MGDNRRRRRAPTREDAKAAPRYDAMVIGHGTRDRRATLRALAGVVVLAPVLACSDAPDDGIPRSPGEQAATEAVHARVSGTGSSGLRVRERPTSASLQIGTLAEGAELLIDCQAEGEVIGGNAVWDHLANEDGYVADAYVDGARGFAKGARRCDAVSAPSPAPVDGTVVVDGPKVQPHVQVFANDACKLVAACRASTYEGHDPSADLALDLPISEAYGKLPTDGNVFGDRLAAFAVDNQAKYRIEYVIFRQRINLGSGWKAMEDRGGITQNHFDHVHVSFLP